MTTVNKSNLYRKVRALLSKTTANGCTAGEAASALQMATNIVDSYGLNRDTAATVWPEPPEGYEWQGDEVVPIKGYVKPEPKAVPKPKAAAKPKASPKQRVGTKQATIIEMMQRPEGATADEMLDATEWLPHTLRGFISGALKKKLGYKVTMVRKDKVTRYWIAE